MGILCFLTTAWGYPWDDGVCSRKLHMNYE